MLDRKPLRIAVLSLVLMLSLLAPRRASAQFNPTSGVVVETLEGVFASDPTLRTDTIEASATFASVGSSRGYCPVATACAFICVTFPCLIGASAASAVANLPTGTLRAIAESNDGRQFNTPA